jgi:ribosomal protein S18 acetylase RimI-like enzyme
MMGDPGVSRSERAIDGGIEPEPPSGEVKTQESAVREQPTSLPLSREDFAPRRRSDGGGEPTDSRGIGIVLGELSAAARPRIAEILRNSRVFSREEIGVALELFDESVGGGGPSAAQRAPEKVASSTPRAVADRALPPSSGLSPDYLFLGAFTPEEVLVGYACWGPTPATDRTWDLYWIAVDTALQGAGIGTILLQEVERRLVGLHARMLIAETSSRSDYAATRAFYARRGYAEAARVRDFYAPGDDRIVFVKRFLPLADRRGAESR